ncbi:MAG: ABC transporter permease [Actinomycetota bacterium]|nr:ABC transporter permease [Actinomycetota bacterium]
MIVLFSVLEPRFLDVDNLSNIARQSVFLLIITLGQMILLLCAQLDLSVGATVALVSVVTSLTMTRLGDGGAGSIAIGIVCGLLTGLVVGAINGFAVTRLKVPAFMVTLGTASAVTGIALILTNGAPVTGLPEEFTRIFGTGALVGIPIPLLVTLVVCLVMYVLLYRTNFGRSVYAIGGNAQAAHVAGIRVGVVLTLAFVTCSLLVATSGVLLTARVASGEATLGASFVLLSIAAAVLGGTSLFGGEGRLGLVILGVLFIGILANGMNLLRISSYLQQVVVGVVLVAAVAVDRYRAHR